MAHFSYTASKSNGDVYTGTAQAADRFELYQMIRREGGHLLSVKEQIDNKYLSFAHWNMKLSRIGEYEKVLLARNLGAMLTAGLALTRALGVIEKQAKNPKLRFVVNTISNDVHHGDNLNTALSKFPDIFSPVFIAMVRAGEEGGDLSGALTTLADQMERMYELKRKVRGALLYPSIIVIAMAGIAYLMMTEVVPSLAQSFEEAGSKLPMSTQIVITISTILKDYTMFALIALVSVVATFYGLMKTYRGRRAFEFTILHIPVIGTIVREVNAARTARTLASLLTAGVDVITTLSITSDIVQNSYFRDVVADARTAVGEGQPLSAAFARREDLYPAFVGEMMSVGEETGATADMMKRLAIFYETEVDRKTKDMSTIIEPFLMVFIGAGVGFFAVSMITPIYQMTQNIN